MAIEVTVLVAVIGCLIAYQTYQLNKNKDTKSDTKQNARIEGQLDSIGKGVDDIRIDLKANEKNTAILSERVTRVEESTKQAHKRLDNVEGGIKK